VYILEITSSPFAFGEGGREYGRVIWRKILIWQGKGKKGKTKGKRKFNICRSGKIMANRASGSKY
jgi:hypothetical protein